jgi:serine/threonine protein kinase
MADLTGQTLGQYRIIGQIGQGGMATVYKAYQPALDRYVAVKVLPPYFAHEPGFAMRFTREAKAIARLNHPNILPIHDFGQEGDLSYIVMKYVEAGTLKEVLGEPLALDVAADIVRQVAEALDHAHQRGILHRDVKPSNVLLDEGRWALLTDFGLAKMVEGSVALTASGVGVGTPAYMAPEQGRGETVDARADVYSLGIVLYELLTGRVPFEAETPMAVVIKHMTEPLPLPRVINPALSEAVERVVLKALAKDPADRFAGAVEMADALTAAVAAAPESVPETVEVPAAQPLPTAPPPSLPESAAVPAPPPAGVQAPARPRRGIPWKAIGALAGVALLTVVAVLVARSLGGAGRGTETPAAVAAVTATAPEKEAAVVVSPSPTHTPPPTPTPTPRPPTPTHTPPPPTPTPTDTLPPPTPTYTHTPTRTPRPPTPTRTPRPPTATPIPTPTPLPPLPGTETIPLADMAPSIPWLPQDPHAIPATYCYGFNPAKPPFDDPLVRQAFALAVDRQVIADVAQGLGVAQPRPATVFTPPGVLGRDLYGHVGLPFDPDRARELLAQAGYPGGQGFPPVTLASSYTDQHEVIAGAVLGMWRDHLGVQLELEMHGDWDAYLELLKTDAPPLFRLGWAGDVNDPDNFLSGFATGAGVLGADFAHPEFDSLIARAADAAGDPATRQRLYIQAEQILCQQEAVVIPLFHWLHSE